MPSLLHEIFAYAIPRLRKATEIDDVEAERGRIERWHQRLIETGQTGLPTDRVRGFDKRYEVSQRDVGFPIWEITGRSAPRSEPGTTVYYLHGGGFVAPIDGFQVKYALKLAAHLDSGPATTVVMPDYPLAPEATWRDSYPQILDDLIARLARGEKVLLAGDSAGGGIAAALAVGVRDHGGPQPWRMLLHAPWVDLSTSTPETYEAAKQDPWLKITKLLPYAEWWAGGADQLTHPTASPVYADLHGLPPTLMFCGTKDLLMPGCRLLADRAAHDGWDLTYLEAPGLIHVFGIVPGLREAHEAFDHTLAWLKRDR